MTPSRRPPVGGRPRCFFGISLIDFAMNYGYPKSKPRGRVQSSAPALTRAKKDANPNDPGWLRAEHATPKLVLNSGRQSPGRSPSGVRGFVFPSARYRKPESQTLTGESGKPAKGLSRRAALAGVAMLPASVVGIPIAAAAAGADAELIALGKNLETLVDPYYVARQPWARALVQRNSELDEQFGNPADRSLQTPPAYDTAANEIDDRVGLDVAADQLHTVFEKVEPIAKAIEALPCTSIEGLRAKALVAFWEVAPLCAGDTEFHFEDAYPFHGSLQQSPSFAGSTARLLRLDLNCQTSLLPTTPTKGRKRDAWDNIVDFPGRQLQSNRVSNRISEDKSRQTRRSTGVNIRTLCFRSYDLIVEADEGELLRDVCLDTHKAEVKLRKVRERLQGERERSAALIELLTAAETRLRAAIVAALLSSIGRDEQ
jgi:hypothetical protein